MRRDFISFPKSGRTWIRYALTRLGLADRIDFHHDGFEYNDATRPPLDFDIERRLSRYRDVGRLVYLHRDPRDVMVSLYFQITGRFRDFFKYEGTIGDFFRDPYFGAKNLNEFQRQWDELCRRGYALRITYEDCHRDFGKVLKDVVDHYELSVSPSDIKKAEQESTFEKMKAIERGGLFSAAWLQLRNESPKVREGKVGAYKERLGERDRQYLNAVFELKD